MAIFAVVFGFVSAVKIPRANGQSRIAKYLPSGVAFAIGFLNTPSFTLARLIGGTIRGIWGGQGSGGRASEITLIVIASGFVLGEGLISIVTLILQSCGVGAVSCWGCGHGLCPACPV